MDMGGKQKRLHRSGDGKIFGGVTVGLGEYFDIDPVIFRIGFIALAFLNGLGVLLYLIAWAILPHDKKNMHVTKIHEHVTTYESTKTK